MLGITHFAVGATGGTLLGEGISLSHAKRLPVAVASGVFAMLPDSNKVVNTESLNWLHDSFFANVFWFHRTLDVLETNQPELEGLVALLALFIVSVFVCVRGEATS